MSDWRIDPDDVPVLPKLEDDLDLPRLQRLRERFLAASREEARGLADYWHDTADLAAYDAVFAARIGWKWEAVCRELAAREVGIADGTVLDYGCGTGIASRTLLRACSHSPRRRVVLHDRSPLALSFAAERLRAEQPGVDVESRASLSGAPPPDVLLVSHVLNELSTDAETALVDLAAHSRQVLWVESGTRMVSRRLGALRDRLLTSHTVLAPCTHEAPCGALTSGDRHWCHFFAPPAAGSFADSRWVQLGRALGVDLRSLPYAFLALRHRDEADRRPGGARLIGRPELRSKFARFFVCDAHGLREQCAWKGRDKEIYKRLKKGPLPRTLTS